MQSENVCRLCLLSHNNIIKFSSEEGLNLQITNIVSQHFWFKVFHCVNLFLLNYYFKDFINLVMYYYYLFSNLYFIVILNIT